MTLHLLIVPSETRKRKRKPVSGEVFFTKAAGIAAEYNPFHFGHLRQIERIRAGFGEDTAVVAVLSGDFVQRGEAACFSKFARAEAAVRCGVSLVLELPLPWCLSSAEGFARGMMGLLQATGIVDIISFGSESADLEALIKCADAIDSPEYSPILREYLTGGISFAAARERTIVDIIGKEAAACLRSPNDLLAVEYIRAAGKEAVYFPVERGGSFHDGAGGASEIRARMASGKKWADAVPAPAEAVFRRETEAGRGPVTGAELRAALLSRLRERTREDFARLPDAAEGLESRLFRAARELDSPEEIAAAAKSRRYALSRLRRMVMCAALGLEKGMADGIPPYLRVLGMDDRGEALLRRMKKSAALPVIVKSARILKEDGRARDIFELTSRAHDLYVLGYGEAASRRGGEDYRRSPFRLGSDEDPE